jgi:hypothetical protein
MMWTAARLFHGRDVLWVAMFAGATAWLLASAFPSFEQSSMLRIVLSSLVVSSYTFLTAFELWRERRKTLISRWPAILVPIMHGLVFLFPIPLASLLPPEEGIISLAGGTDQGTHGAYPQDGGLDRFLDRTFESAGSL